MKKKIFENIEISNLLSKYIKGQYNDTEESKLKTWLNQSARHQKLLNKIMEKENWEERQELIKKINLDYEWSRFESRTQFARNKMKAVLKYAAILLVPIAIGSYFLFQDTARTANDTNFEIAPGVKKAQLILSTGEKIDLSDKDQLIVLEKNISVTNKNQSLNYSVAENIDNDVELVYNQLVIGTGEEYQLVLSDGTKVWLNSETQLKYPAQFASSIREVELKGEAYFEVAKNKEAPFIVKTPDMDIEVLGTKFNISAYSNDYSTKTTLLEGAVKVRAPEQNTTPKIILKPNEQAIFDKANNTFEVKVVDPQMYIGWVNGYFVFDEVQLDQIMVQLSRWYNIHVVFNDQNAMNSQFSGKLPRFEDCNILLDMIEKTTNLNFTIKEENTVEINSIK